MNTLRIKVLTDFSETPGSRYRNEGDWSGQEFFEELLAPRFKEALDAGSILEIDLDDTAGYATSFLDEAFGRLGKLYDEVTIGKHMKIVCEDEPYLLGEIQKYIHEAKQQQSAG